MQQEKGVLYVVATPIGNLGDITQRAIDVLSSVGRVYAEDTRHTARLFNHLGVRADLVSLHDHNESARVSEVLDYLNGGEDAALVSDAGTPLISDPGYRLIAACHESGVQVSPLPGASAVVAALSVSGLATDSFLFLGFPSSKREARKTWFATLAEERHTLVFYESKHRIISTLQDMILSFGEDRKITLCRELTKQFETIKRDTLLSMSQWVESDPNQQKGEYVLLLQGFESLIDDTAEIEKLLGKLLPDVSVKRSSEIVSDLLGVKKNKVYKIALEMTQ